MHHARSLSIGLAFVLFLVVSAGAAPVGTAFTYQGRLEDAGAPANGIYDLEFALYDASTAGSQIGSTIAKEDVAVANGVFVVALDFGGSAFSGSARWLEIGVRPGSSPAAYETLVARQELTPTPYALRSGAAETAGDLSCSGCVAEAELAFDPATQAEMASHVSSGDHDTRYVLKSGDTMTGALGLPVDGLAVASNQLVLAGGNVGIGTPAPGQKLTVAGAIESTTGGFRFPDGTSQTTAPAIVFTRWGKTSCPTGAQLVYTGYAASGNATQSGGGRNVLCLSGTPTWLSYSDLNENGNLVYGVEYETASYGVSTLAPLQNFDAPCAVCLRTSASVVMMVPGTTVCPSAWNLEYRGYLMSTHYSQQGGETMCVDESPDTIGSVANVDGHLWYPTEAECGSLPCPPYVQNRELTCGVCSR